MAMEENFQVVHVEKPEDSAWGIIGWGLDAYNIAQAGQQNFQRLCYALQGSDEGIVGGVLGEIYWEWLHIDLLWIKEELRGRGYGSQLLAAVEEGARQRGATNVFLDTFSFQAPDFYTKHGYRVFGELPDFPPGHQRYFLMKVL